MVDGSFVDSVFFGGDGGDRRLVREEKNFFFKCGNFLLHYTRNVS